MFVLIFHTNKQPNQCVMVDLRHRLNFRVNYLRTHLVWLNTPIA